MNRETLEDAIALGDAVGHVFVATASAQGVPHLASAGELPSLGQGRVAVKVHDFSQGPHSDTVEGDDAG